jgi:hypothetical protein
MLPGYEVKFRDGGLPRGVVGSTDQGFGVAEAERGPTEATLITSWTQLLAVFGGRLSTSFLYDAAETAFAIGLRRLWVARVTGPAAARAGLNLSDVVPATTLRIDAKWVDLRVEGGGVDVERDGDVARRSGADGAADRSGGDRGAGPAGGDGAHGRRG